MNQILESARIAVGAIWGAKLRAFMTVLGNIVAVTSIIVVVALIRGLNESVTDAILSQAGADSFSIQQYPVARGDMDFERVRGNPLVSLRDATAVRRYATSASAVMAEATANARVGYRGKAIDSTRIRGVTADYVQFSSFDAERGRLMSSIEVAAGRPVAVIGWQTADRLFGSEVDPLDKAIQVAGRPFRVVGVSAKKGSLLGQSQDEFVVLPLEQFTALFGSRRSLSLTVKPRDMARIRETMDEAIVALRASRRLRPAQTENFGVFTSDTFLDIYNQATTGIFAVLVGVVALSLVVGGIVIMNIMLMAVSERTREIGLRKALGAKRRDILVQILTESIVLSVFGGVVGTVFGGLIALAIATATPVPAAVEVWSVSLGIGITALVGLFFGIYPAQRASRLDPIEALRRE